MNSKKSLEMILLQLQMYKIAISGGSACSSGTQVPSVVKQYVSLSKGEVVLRVSFGLKIFQDIYQSDNTMGSAWKKNCTLIVVIYKI